MKETQKLKCGSNKVLFKQRERKIDVPLFSVRTQYLIIHFVERC